VQVFLNTIIEGVIFLLTDIFSG